MSGSNRAKKERSEFRFCADDHNLRDVIAIRAAATPRHEIWAKDGPNVDDRLLGLVTASSKLGAV